MNHIKLLSGIIILLCMAACGGGEAARRMDLADSLMEQNPDSALSILQSIDSASITSTKLHARHTLLTTQAKVKTNLLNSAGDTTALRDLRYYNDHGSDFDRMRAAFYKGWIYYINNKHREAFRELSVARDLAELDSDYYWLAKIFEIKADIYDMNGIHAAAVNARNNTINFYKKARKTDNAFYAMCDLSIDYKNLGNPEKALGILEQVLDSQPDPHNLDRSFHCYLLHKLTLVYYNLQQYTKADSCQNLLDSLAGRDYDYLGGRKMKAFIAVMLDKPSADSLMNEYRDAIENGSDSVIYYSMMRYIAYSRGELLSANRFADSILLYQNSEVSRVISQSVPLAELHIQKNKTDLSKKANNRLFILVIVLVFI